MYTQFEHMDIYSDIHPFKESAILLGGQREDPEKRYINANRITSIYGEPAEESLIIAAQGPIEQSTRNFWKLVN